MMGFLEEFEKAVLQQFREHLLLVLTPEHSNNDIDIFIILKDSNNSDDPYNMNIYIELIRAVKMFEKKYEKETNVPVIDFSTYRIEEYHTNLLSYNLSRENVMKLHLLIYPSLLHFLMWEPYSIIISIATHSKEIFGDIDILRKALNSVPKKPLYERIQPLFSLLIETYRNIKIPYAIDEQGSTVLIKEGTRKLNYIVKFTLWEFLMEKWNSVPSTNLEDIIRSAQNIESLIPLVEILKDLQEEKNTTLNDLITLYEKTMFEFQKLLYFHVKGGMDI